MTNPDVLERLDLMLAVLQLAHHDDITRASTEIRSDPVMASILDAAEDWVRAGPLKDAVAKQTNVNQKTVQRRIAELVARRALVSQGAGPTIHYRALGLV